MSNKLKLISGGIVGAVLILLVVIYFLFFKTCTVTYNAKLGPGIQSIQVKKGTKLEKPTYSYQGYILKGWYVDGELYDFNTPVTEDITLTAEWEQVTN